MLVNAKKESPSLIILGPTATGKSALALELAKITPCEIISMDSMQIYRGMDIGTAKPNPEELALVPHHLIDTHTLEDFSDVGSYLEMVVKEELEIRAHNLLPLLVGGTAMYLKILLEGLFSGPKADENLRAELRQILSEKGPKYLHDEILAPLDPVCAERIHENDTLRVIRAIEVCKLTGKPLSSQQTQWSEKKISNYRLIGLTWPRPILYEKIEARVDLMLEKGLLEEVKKLKAKGIEKNPRAASAIGYKQILAYLNGEYDFKRAIELVKRDTRRFAKHQLTWFRHFENVEWHDLAEEGDLKALAQRLLS